MLNEEVTLKENNFINKDCTMRTKDYFELFFPFATNDEMSYTITNGKAVIETNSDLQRMLNRTSLNEQLIYSSFYCEKIDWIIDYAKKMYNIFKKATDLANNNIHEYDEYRAKETINNYYFSVSIVAKYFMLKTLKLNMIVANVETKQMYIKAEIKINQIKIINYINYPKNIVFEIKIKYNKFILFQRKSLRKEGFIYELPRFDLAFG